MMRAALLAGGLLLGAVAHGVTLSGQHTEGAHAGETEAVVCQRALDVLRRTLTEQLQADLRRGADYQRLHQLHVRRGQQRADLDVALARALDVQLQVTETGRYWSGRRCFVQGVGELDEDQMWAALHAALPPPPPPSPPQDDDRRDAAGWLDGLPTLFTGSTAFHTALAELVFLRQAVTEYYQFHGRWPGTLAEMNVSAGDLAQLEAIELVELGPDGELVASLAGELEGERIHLVPRASAHMVRWRCSTTIDSWIARSCR